jgi:hypothetical protein
VSARKPEPASLTNSLKICERCRQVSCPRNTCMFRCDQNGPPARRSEPNWHQEGAYLKAIRNRRATQPPPLFIATLRAAASWLFFRVARSLRIKSRYARRYRESGSAALKNSQLTGGKTYTYFGDKTLAKRRLIPLHSKVVSLDYSFELFFRVGRRRHHR